MDIIVEPFLSIFLVVCVIVAAVFLVVIRRPANPDGGMNSTQKNTAIVLGSLVAAIGPMILGALIGSFASAVVVGTVSGYVVGFIAILVYLSMKVG